MSKELTAKQKLFVYEYLIDLNATQAAIRAGYSEKTAADIGCENLTKPEIAAAIQLQMDKRAHKVELTAARVLQEVMRIAMVDLAEAFDDNGKLLPLKQMPEDIRRAIAGFDVYHETVASSQDADGDPVNVIGTTEKIKMTDKLKALELLGKHLKLFADQLEVKDVTKIAEKMALARKRVNKGE